MTAPGLLPSHHVVSSSTNGKPATCGGGVATAKKNEVPLMLMVGLVVIVLLSTQSVLSAVTNYSSSQKLVVDMDYSTSTYGRVETTPHTQQHTQSVLNPGTTVATASAASLSSSSSSSKRPTSLTLQKVGWMQAVIEYRVKLANIAYEMEQFRRNNAKDIAYQATSLGKYTMDISPLYDLISEMVDVIGVRGIIFDCLSDDYDYFLYYPDKPSWYCTSNHGVGDCLENEAWWFYHYTGAIIADKFLRDGTGKLLWDGVTGRYVDDFTQLIHEIQRFQQLPRVNEASFHVEHALLWHFFASVMPDMSEYPSDVANTLCRWDSHIREKGIKGRGVGKGLTHECYHGIGHAAFYVVAKRQARRSMSNTTNVETLSHPVAPVTMKIPEQKSANNETEPKSDVPSLVVKANGVITVSMDVAIELAKATSNTSSARIQFRPNIGFELTPESMCEVYQFCKGATRQSDEHFVDREAAYPYSTGVRVCLEGVVHSVRLFGSERHDKKEAINYVNTNMKRCQSEELAAQ